MISEDPKHENKGTCRIVWWDKSSQQCLLFLSKQTAGSKITALCKQRVCFVCSKQNKSGFLWKFTWFLCESHTGSQESRGSWQWAEFLQTPSPWAELSIPPQSTKTALCTHFSLFNGHFKKSCVSRSIFLHYALRKISKNQFYSWNWKST